MEKLTKSEVTKLGQDIAKAKAEVLLRWGFSIEEIATALNTTERVVENYILKRDYYK